jgi:hypothetical protein
MSKTICPGQDTRFWRPGDIFDVACANCGAMVEFWKDEGRRKCPRCGTRIQNPRLSLGCAQWCEHARECLGFDPTGREDEPTERAAVDRILDSSRRALRSRPELIARVEAALERAKGLVHAGGADPRVTLAAVILRPLIEGIGWDEGLETAKTILRDERLDPEAADRTLEILRGREDSAEARMVEEAFRLQPAGDEIIEAPGTGGLSRDDGRD